jgi:hypothetical protein
MAASDHVEKKENNLNSEWSQKWLKTGNEKKGRKKQDHGMNGQLIRQDAGELRKVYEEP